MISEKIIKIPASLTSIVGLIISNKLFNPLKREGQLGDDVDNWDYDIAVTNY